MRQISLDDARPSEDVLGRTLLRVMRDEQLHEARAELNGVGYVAGMGADGAVEIVEDGRAGAVWRSSRGARLAG